MVTTAQTTIYPRLEDKKRKGTCPNCGHKNQFRFYAIDGVRCAEEFGKCERTNNCGYHLKPNGQKVEARERPEQKPVEIIRASPERTLEMLAKTHDFNNPIHALAQTLGVPSSHLQKWAVATDGQAVAYLHLNRQGELCNAKWSIYTPNGKRDKNRQAWSFKQPEAELCQQYQFCLYGEHLLSDDLTRPVCVVESEKSAVLASFFYPEFDWLACGSANGISDAKIGPLHNRLIYWLCDADGNTHKHINGVPQYHRDGQQEMTEGGRRNSSLRKLKAYGIQHHALDLFPNRTDGYDIADALLDGLRPVIALSASYSRMNATPTTTELTEAQQVFIRNQSAKGTIREQIAQLLKADAPAQPVDFTAAVDNLLDAPDPEIGTFGHWYPAAKQVLPSWKLARSS